MKNKLVSTLAVCLLAMACTLSVCPGVWATEQKIEAIKNAVAVVHSVEKHGVYGVITFSKEPEGIRVVANVWGLVPGEHDFYICEDGDCRSAAGTKRQILGSRKDAPAGSGVAQKPAGDLGTLLADDTGHGTIDHLYSSLQLVGADSIIGRSVVVKLQTNNLAPAMGPNPKGVACGVIGISKYQ